MREWSSFFFFNDTATTEIYTLSLHDALPIYLHDRAEPVPVRRRSGERHFQVPHLRLRRQVAHEHHRPRVELVGDDVERSEEHTSELQSRQYLVCRLLLEKKKIIATTLRS